MNDANNQININILGMIEGITYNIYIYIYIHYYCSKY